MDDSLVGYTSDDNKIQLLQVIQYRSYEIMQKQAYMLPIYREGYPVSWC